MRKDYFKDLVDEVIYNQIDGEVYTKEIVPELTHNRFDLAFKLLFLESLKSDSFSSSVIDMYYEHISAFSLGSYQEPGNNEKNTKEKFKEVFISLYNDIKSNGFDDIKSLVPLAKDGSLLNGAHRSSISIELNKKIKVLKTNLLPYNYDYKFFYNRNVSRLYLEKAAVKFIDYSKNTYIAFVWPTARAFDKSLKTLFSNIVYMRNIKLNSNGAHNLLSVIYEGESWLGSIEDNFAGVTKKKIRCFRSYDHVRVIAFQASSLEEVVRMKEEIRDFFKVGKHSIHITDTKEEAVRISRIVFNKNGVNFLNVAKPNNFLSFHKQIYEFKKNLKKNGNSIEDFILGPEMTLACIGVRESNKIDYLANDEINKNNFLSKLEGMTPNELIYNSNNYFYYKDIKFLSLSHLINITKSAVLSNENNISVDYLESLIKQKDKDSRVVELKQSLLLKIELFKFYLLVLLKKIGLYNMAKKVFFTLKKLK